MPFTDSQGSAVDLPDGKAVTWRISAYAIILKNGKFLMTQSGNGQWVFPGGGVEERETVLEAVVRECLEETGYTITVGNPQPSYVREQQFYHTREEAFYHSIQLFYPAELASDMSDTDAITDYDKTRAIDWVDLKFTDLHQIHPTIRELVQKLIK